MNTVIIHDNYLDPFKVTFFPRHDCPVAFNVSVYKYMKFCERSTGNEDEEYNYVPIQNFKICRIFIPVDSDIFGNTLLLRLLNNEYVYISGVIYSFFTEKRTLHDSSSLAIITDFFSPIGPNDLPYPYAVDEDNNTYLLQNQVILNKVYIDPYEYYYNAKLITEDCAYHPPQQPIFLNNFGITQFFVEDEMYTMIFDPDAEMVYNRLTENGRLKMFVTTTNSESKKIELSKAEYVETLCSFGKQIGVKKLDVISLVKRTHPFIL